jgi:putative transposase
MKYSFMKEHEKEFSIERMSFVFKVFRGGYYRFLSAKASTRRIENSRLLEVIKKIPCANRQVYGHTELRMQGENCSRKRVAKLMTTEGLQAKMKHRFKRTTHVDLLAKKAPWDRPLRIDDRPKV